MTDSKLTEVVQLPLGSLEMQLIATSLRFGMAAVTGDILDQLQMRYALAKIFKQLGPSGYNALQAKLINLSRAGFSDLEIVIDSDPTGEL